MGALPPAPEYQQWIIFDDGRVAFLAPLKFETHREEDETVAIYPPGDSGITLRFSLHPNTLGSEKPADVGEKFVADEASQRKLKLTKLADRIFLEESYETDGPEPDRRVLMHCWQIGVGRILIVASATIWGSDRNSETVRDALSWVPKIIESIRLV
jgi:hypothetical protein